MIKDTDKIKEIPLFSKGALIFKESKHKLVKNGDYFAVLLMQMAFVL